MEHLDGRVPLLGADGFVRGVVRSWWLEFLCRHYNSSIFSFFQFGSFFSRAFISPSDLNRYTSYLFRVKWAENRNITENHIWFHMEAKSVYVSSEALVMTMLTFWMVHHSIHCCQMMNPNDSGDPLTTSLTSFSKINY